MKDTTRVALDEASMLKCPSMSVIVPPVLSFTFILAPITASPVLSFTVPVILAFCAVTLQIPIKSNTNTKKCYILALILNE